MKVPLFRPRVRADAAFAVERVLNSGNLTEGLEVAQFEEELADFMPGPTPLPVTTNSATSALELAYHVLRLGAGDEVITTPMTCVATNVPLLRRGVKIVWADVDPVTGIIDPKDVARRATSKTKAVVAVDWGGRTCDWPALSRASRGLVVEDAAHAFGLARQHGGDFVCFSFQAIKHLTTGDGGAIWTKEPDIADRLRLLRWFGLSRKVPRMEQDLREPGFKFHMNDIAAAIGRVNLKYAYETINLHRDNAWVYMQAFEDEKGLRAPPWDPDCPWWLYTILVNDRDSFMSFMADEGVETSPVHKRNDLHRAFPSLDEKEYPGLKVFGNHAVAIPVGAHVPRHEIVRIAELVLEWSKR